MINGLENQYKIFHDQFEAESSKYFKNQSDANPQLSVLWQSMQYTYFLDAKRFRPFLSFLVCDLFKKDFKAVLPFAVAIECIHTYSLIHDDLPSLDNDDFRRGKPSNHKVYGEDVALLSGDALLTECFNIIASMQCAEPKNILEVIKMVSQKIGAPGMVGGQVLDMKVNSKIELNDLENIHRMKTAYLIEAAVIGPAILLNATAMQVSKLSEFAIQLGISFQIKDDLLDGLDHDQDFKNYIKILGLEKTESELKMKSKQALSLINDSCFKNLDLTGLVKVIEFNLTRKK
jgi:geranylgeranyl diphosphate synthase, type II